MFDDLSINRFYKDVSQCGIGEFYQDWYVCINWSTGNACLIAGSISLTRAF